jgi:ubiquinone/menaquinone biosynthesis C-methylase UbiE
MSADPLQKRYSGHGARTYEKTRHHNRRWQLENQAFTKLMGEASPRSVLDCPFGTGRWVDWYKPLPGPIIAIDRSPDMLDEARHKIGDDPKYRLIVGDILTHDFAQHRGEIDLVVCVRLLNWMRWPDAQRAIRRLSDAGSQYMIIGVTVMEGNAWSRMRQRMCIAQSNSKARRSGAAPHYVHSQPALTDVLRDSGWQIFSRHRTFERPFGVNDLYGLKRL